MKKAFKIEVDDGFFVILAETASKARAVFKRETEEGDYFDWYDLVRLRITRMPEFDNLDRTIALGGDCLERGYAAYCSSCGTLLHPREYEEDGSVFEPDLYHVEHSYAWCLRCWENILARRIAYSV